MNREILTHPIPAPAVWRELQFLIAELEKIGHTDLQVQFGFAWANEFYPNGQWNEVVLSGSKLIEEIRRLEASSAGKLGLNDLFIRIPVFGVEFHFCNDSDIHIKFENPSEFTESFYSRWKNLGFTPAEWITTSKDCPREKVREN